MSKQLTFPRAINATAIYPDGSQTRLRFGHYESVMIVKENGLDVGRTVPLTAPYSPVTEVECEDGVKLIFDSSFYCVEKAATGHHAAQRV